MPMTPELRRGIERIRDYLFGGGYPNPAQNAEQLSFLIYFYMYEAADAARVRAASRPGAEPHVSVFEGHWTLHNPRNAPRAGRCGRSARTPALVLLGACAQRRAAGELGEGGSLSVFMPSLRPEALRTSWTARGW